MIDDEMPPKPECEFVFDLPHGIDAEDDFPLVQGPIATPKTDDLMVNVQHINQGLDAQVTGNEDDEHQTMHYGILKKGFSDDEGGNEAFDRSWTAHQARKATPKQKRSPRRLRDADDDADDYGRPRSKRPRISLFGGMGEDVSKNEPRRFADHQNEDRIEDQDEDLTSPETSTPSIRPRMSSLNIHQGEAHDVGTFNLGFGLGVSERDSMSPVLSRAHSEESVDIPPRSSPAYPLRQNINRTKAITHIDTDKTGDYHPSLEGKRDLSRLHKAKPVKATRMKDKAKVQKKHVKKCIVTLPFEAYGNVRNITNDEDKWPEGWSDIDIDLEHGNTASPNSKRCKTLNFDRQIASPNADEDIDDLTGYPTARGCKHCREDRLRCSMVEGGTYPCDQCEDDDNNCIPILTPVVKGGCKQCVEDGQERCSFEDDSDQAICNHCDKHEFICEALPPRGYKTPRISIDDIMYSSSRMHIQCTFCRVEKKKCSLKKKTDKPPCKYCKKHGIGCTFYHLPKTARETRAAAKQKAALVPTVGSVPEVSRPSATFFSPEDLEDMMRDDEELISREDTTEVEMEDGAGNKGLLTKIRTSFAHPIQFNSQGQQASDCSFCEMPMFGFVGHFEREVHVIQWYSGLGYTETGGGHCEESGMTTMCFDCSLTRLQIICCPDHVLQSMSEDTTALDFEVMARELIKSETASPELRYQLQRWCSMCFSVAAWGCSKVQPSLDGDDDAEIVGCGLRLCDKCITALRDNHYWGLEEMAAEMEWRPKTGKDDEQLGDLTAKVRADVGFLRSDGLLMRSVNSAEGEKEL